jgi:hypothetical protein
MNGCANPSGRVRRADHPATVLTALLTACSPTVDLGHNGADLQLTAPRLIVAQDGAPARLAVTLGEDARAAGTTVTCDGLPAGVTCMRTLDYQPPSSEANLVVQATPDAMPGDTNITVTVTARTGAQSLAQPLTVTVGIVAKVGTVADGSKGSGGMLDEVMSTSLQPASFQRVIPNPQALAALAPQHIHVQAYEPPWKANPPADQQQHGDWDFSVLDPIVLPLLVPGGGGPGDGYPELQIATPPMLPGTLNANGNFDFSSDANVQVFAQYCAYLVQYYNGGGFSWAGETRRPVTDPGAPPSRIAWWGILSDYNNADSNTKDYVRIFNAAAAAMRQVDPSIQISALEFTDDQTMPPASYLPDFVAAGGVDPHTVNAISVHMFATFSNAEAESDTTLFGAVPGFHDDLRAILQMLSGSALAGTPVWVTQSNVNSNYPTVGGGSASSSGPFVNDLRGTHPFFAAWRPYMFSQLGQAGNSALYQWEYTSGHDPGAGSLDLDAQNAEVNYDDSTAFLSYWVDRALAETYSPVPSAAPQSILTLTTTESTPATVDLLATAKGDGTVVVMFSDIAVDPRQSNDGPGQARTVIVDLSAFQHSGSPPVFASATTRTIDVATDVSSGPGAPKPIAIPADNRVPLTLGGYGVEFLTLVRASQ